MNIKNNINNNLKKQELFTSISFVSKLLVISFISNFNFKVFHNFMLFYFAYHKSLFKNNELCRMYKPSYTTFADPFTYEIITFINSNTLNYIQLFCQSLNY